MHSDYRGRFAPSPTGPLHFGSLVTAVASYLEARTCNGTWLVRIEDLDPLRESQEAASAILHSLEAHHLNWDDTVRYQSARHDAYAETLNQLVANQNAYRCICSRKELTAHNGRHPHHCRDRTPNHKADDVPFATRFRLDDQTIEWPDRLLGPQSQTLRAEIDDPVIQRKEGFYAYQLAVVVDDIDQRITDIVRGSDLLETTASQICLYRVLAATPPGYLHIPVILNTDGQKLSKQTHATALNDRQPGQNLWQALSALGQQPPPALFAAPPVEILAWAEIHWTPSLLPLAPAQQLDSTPDSAGDPVV
ncbi:tRNA glutamyl-Q(34) synthetase GluQRS [Marinobacter sp. 1Y8]